MKSRIEQELELLRSKFPDLEYRPEGQWVRISNYPRSSGWSVLSSDVVFQIPIQYPATPPYSFFVPAGAQFNGLAPDSYSENHGVAVPFSGVWGRFSWAPEGAWQPKDPISAGSNLVNWTLGFSDRFKEGK